MPLSDDDMKRIDDLLKLLDPVTAAGAVINFTNFTRWLSGDYPDFYQKVKPYIYEIYNRIKKRVTKLRDDFNDGFGEVADFAGELIDDGIKQFKKFWRSL